MTETSLTSPETLFKASPPAEQRFDAKTLEALPSAARRYLEYSIAPQTPLARSVRLSMHGEIKLNRWLPFRAEQVIAPETGMIWKARVRMFGLPIHGSDRIIGHTGAMKWKALGLLPIVNAEGPDITRSTAGRMAGELMWLPTYLCRHPVQWSEGDAREAIATINVLGFEHHIHFRVDKEGRLQELYYQRWGEPGDNGFRSAIFGARIEQMETFGGYTIPSRLLAGWHYGNKDFEKDGAFFRVMVDEATFK